jgi:hypothetical protein
MRKVAKGGPKVLSNEVANGRNLFLCYPDEASSLGVRCLKYFTGEYVIHVGELMITGCSSGYPQVNSNVSV